jgi:hypothetical protein
MISPVMNEPKFGIVCWVFLKTIRLAALGAKAAIACFRITTPPSSPILGGVYPDYPLGGQEGFFLCYALLLLSCRGRFKMVHRDIENVAIDPPPADTKPF